MLWAEQASERIQAVEYLLRWQNCQKEMAAKVLLMVWIDMMWISEVKNLRSNYFWHCLQKGEEEENPFMSSCREEPFFQNQLINKPIQDKY